MNSEEARFILSSLRPDSSDLDDPRFAEALECAENDPELKSWLEAMQRQDLVISEKLGTLETPPELKSTILAGLHVSQAKPARKRRNVLLMAAAAAVGALAVALTFLSLPDSGPANDPTTAFREEMIREIQSLGKFDFVSEDPDAVATWLNANASEGEIEFPADMKALKTAGCKLLDWKGNKASLICFHLTPEAPGPTVHLVVVDTELFPELEMDTPRIETHQSWASAMWKDDGKTYLITTVHPASSLRNWTGRRS